MLLYTSLYSDIYTKGEKIFSIMCDKEKVSALPYHDIQALKQQIEAQNLCGNLNENQYKALGYFLSQKKKKIDTKSIQVPQKSHCPVCGMFVDKFPKWATMMRLKSGKTYYFDGVKDMMKFYFDPKRFHQKKAAIQEILVSDYYTLKAIDAQKAYYVLGSNIYGPMGEELIPFASKSSAKHFLDEHHGKKIVTFAMIQENFLY